MFCGLNGGAAPGPVRIVDDVKEGPGLTVFLYKDVCHFLKSDADRDLLHNVNTKIRVVKDVGLRESSFPWARTHIKDVI